MGFENLIAQPVFSYTAPNRSKKVIFGTLVSLRLCVYLIKLHNPAIRQ